MIRKNAVESILAERDILINVHNPFVVSFSIAFFLSIFFPWQRFLISNVTFLLTRFDSSIHLLVAKTCIL